MLNIKCLGEHVLNKRGKILLLLLICNFILLLLYYYY